MMLDPRPGLVGGPIARRDGNSQSKYLRYNEPCKKTHRKEFYHRSAVIPGTGLIMTRRPIDHLDNGEISVISPLFTDISGSWHRVRIVTGA